MGGTIGINVTAVTAEMSVNHRNRIFVITSNASPAYFLRTAAGQEFHDIYYPVRHRDSQAAARPMVQSGL